MKRFLLLVLMGAMTLNSWCANGDIVETTTFEAMTVEGVGLCYTVISESEKTCKVDECDGDNIAGTVTIPSTVNGYTVVAIEQQTFEKCSAITKVNIPGTVKTIGYRAFYYCKGLTEIEIPEGVEAIGKEAFYSCTHAESLSLPGTLKSIGEYTFYDCHGLTEIEIPEGVETIGNSAFCYCENAVSLYLPSTVKSIGEKAFYSCDGLTEIEIPEGVETIGNSAFCYCENAVSLYLPSSLKSIGSSAFDGGKKRTKVIIPDLASWCAVEVGSYGSGIFNKPYKGSGEITHLYSDANTEIVDLVIPKGVTTIRANVFYQLSTIKSVVIPTGVTTIGETAFYGCDGLECMTIPNSLKKIEHRGISYCGKLSKFIIPDIAAWCSLTMNESVVAGVGFEGLPTFIHIYSDKNTEIENLIIPEGVQSIRSNAFSGCIGLKTIIIPKWTTSIGNRAFYNCMGLQAIYSQINIPMKIDTLAFGNETRYISNIIYNTIPLYVPKGRKAVYEATRGWKDFAEIIEREFVEPEQIVVTNISQMDNAIYIDPFSARIGGEVAIEVKLKNVRTATSYGFELQLPVGMSINVDEQNAFDDAVVLSTRNGNHQVATNKLDNGNYKIAVVGKEAITDNDGAVMTITAHVAESLTEGQYVVRIAEPLLVLADESSAPIAATQTVVSVDDHIKGDVNGDGRVDLVDAVKIINYYVGKTESLSRRQAVDELDPQ